MNSNLVLASILVFGACGGDDGGSGGGGVPRSTRLTDLTQAQTDALCHAEASNSPKRTITCDDGSTVDSGVDDAECSPADPIDVSSSCTATVGDLEDCFDALDDLTDQEECDQDSIPEECAFLFSCGDDGSDDGSGARMLEAVRMWSRATSTSRN